MKVFYDKDADLSLIKAKNVTIVGYGSQGHAHAQNLNDSGVKVVVGLRKGGASWDKVGKAGLNVLEVNDAVKAADVVMILLPDEDIAAVYKNNVEPNIKQGASLAFAHGFNVHYNQVVPRADLDVWMVAPKAPGHTVRNTYTQGGGVLVGVRQRQGQLMIQVWDTGSGIAPQDQRRIFEDFVQLDNPGRNRAKGLGLGLAIVQRAAQLLGSDIGLRSRLGKGSCFSIVVPQALPASASPHAPNLAPTTTAQRPLEDRHIVVVDDDDTLRLALRERLRDWGAFVSAVSSLDDLDELLQRVMSVDLLLTDHRLRDGDGLQAISMARSLHPHLPAVVITGDTGAEPLRQLQDSGVPVLHKPFQSEELLATLLASWAQDAVQAKAA